MNTINSIVFQKRKELALLFFLKVIVVGFTVGISLLIDYLIDTTSVNELLTKTLVALGYVLLYFLFQFFDFRLTFRYTFNASLKLRMQMFGKYVVLPPQKFHEEETGFYLSRLINDNDSITNYYITSVFDVIDQGLTFIMACAISFYINWIIALVLISLSLFIIVIPFFFDKKMTSAQNNRSKAVSSLTKELKEALEKHDLVLAYELQQKISEQVGTKTTTFIDSLKKHFYVMLDNAFVSLVAVTMIQVVIIIIATYLVINGDLSSGSIAAILVLSSFIYNPLPQIASKVSQIRGSKGLRDAIDKELSFAFTKSVNEYSFAEKIKFRNVGLSFGEKTVFNDLNFEIFKGKKYLLLGDNGTGKSTIMKLLLKFLEPTTGTIEIDQKNYQDIDYRSLVPLFAYVEQRPQLITGSLKNNIVLDLAFDKKRYESVLALSGASTIKRDFELTLDERNPLSGGEAQKISIARALYRNAPILIFDEATAALDKEAETLFFNNILALNKTCVFIVHKLNKEAESKFDFVYQFDNDKKTFLKK